MKKRNNINIRKIKVSDAKNLLIFLNKLVKFDPERAERPEDIKEIRINAEINWIKVLVYFQLVSQKIGLPIMKKIGFYQAGIIKNYYKRRGEYIDRVYMAMSL